MPASNSVLALVELQSELTVLMDRLAADPAAADDVLTDHKLRLRLAEHAVRLAAVAAPLQFLEELERSEMLAWIHDPTLYRRALYERGPENARRLLRAVTPAARLYAAVQDEAVRS
jgi:anti-sigma factor RsiW